MRYVLHPGNGHIVDDDTHSMEAGEDEIKIMLKIDNC